MRTRPSWLSSDLDEATQLALRAAAEPTLHDDRFVVRARTDHADLILVDLADGEPWAIVGLITQTIGAHRAMQLTTVVPTDRAEYFAQGSGWWPDETSRWAWAVGRLPAGSSDTVEAVVDDTAVVLPLSPSGWFATMVETNDTAAAVRVHVVDRQGTKRPLN